MFVPKRDSLGFVSINDFYDYIRCIFDDINKSVVNKQYDDYALQINPETLEYEIGKIDELPISLDTYPLKEWQSPISCPMRLERNMKRWKRLSGSTFPSVKA